MHEMVIDKNMKILFQSLQKTGSNGNVSEFRIFGLSVDGLKFAKNSLKNKKYFACEVFVDGELVIKGDDCFFNNIMSLGADADLVMNWTE